jgi:hypothetical protein
VKEFLPTDPANFNQQFWQNDSWWDNNVELVKERWQRWILA